jgi:hypothetical protein
MSSPRRERLEELVRQRILKHVLQSAVLAPHGASMTVVTDAITARLHNFPSSGAWTERELKRITDEIASAYPTIAAVAPPSPHYSKSSASVTVPLESIRSALMFPPLQKYSPRSRTVGAAVQSPRDQAPPSAQSARPSLDKSNKTMSASAVNPPYALFEQLPKPPTTARSGTREALLCAGGESGEISPTRKLRPKPPQDMWSRMTQADHALWKQEQTAKQENKLEMRDVQRNTLEGQIAEKTKVSCDRTADDLRAHHIAEEYRRRQDEKHASEEARRRDADHRVKNEIARQLARSEARKARQRLREKVEDKQLKDLYDRQLQEERSEVVAKRQAAYEVQQQSLAFNAAAQRRKQEERAMEAERDRAAARHMDAQMEAAEVARTAHLAKVQSYAQRSQVMAASLQASFEQKAKETEQRAAREAAIADAAAAAKAKADKDAKDRRAADLQILLEKQMAEQARLHAEEAARERALAEQLRRDAAASKADEAARTAARRHEALLHRHVIEEQIARKEHATQRPGDLTQTERSMNRQYLQLIRV